MYTTKLAYRQCLVSYYNRTHIKLQSIWAGLSGTKNVLIRDISVNYKFNSFPFRDDKYLFRLDESLRAFLLKLNVCDSQLKPLPEGIYFESMKTHRQTTGRHDNSLTVFFL